MVDPGPMLVEFGRNRPPKFGRNRRQGGRCRAKVADAGQMSSNSGHNWHFFCPSRPVLAHCRPNATQIQSTMCVFGRSRPDLGKHRPAVQEVPLVLERYSRKCGALERCSGQKLGRHSNNARKLLSLMLSRKDVWVHASKTGHGQFGAHVGRINYGSRCNPTWATENWPSLAELGGRNDSKMHAGPQSVQALPKAPRSATLVVLCCPARSRGALRDLASTMWTCSLPPVACRATGQEQSSMDSLSKSMLLLP